MGDERRLVLIDAVGEGELEVRDNELLDVRAADVLGLLDLDDAEDLHICVSTIAQKHSEPGHVRGSTGSGHGGAPPCPGRGS